MNFGYKKLYIGGKLVDSISNERKPVICPATNKPVAEIAWAGKADAELAMVEAQKGFEYWSKLSLNERTEWMQKLRAEVLKHDDLLRKAVCLEMGKPYDAAWEDVEAIVNGLDFYPGAMKNLHEEMIPDLDGTHTHKMVHQPAGVAVAYLAWNFPLLNVGYKIGPALAAGCSIIIKPSDLSPLSSYVLGEILHNMDFPAGVINFVCGSVEEVAQTMTTSKIPRVLTMIGSSRAGRQIIADSATSIKKVSLELGGNAPFIVCKDADIDLAVNIGIALKYGNCGQICVAPNRFLIQEEVYDQFLERFIEKAKAVKVGFDLDGKPDMGPMVSAQAKERTLQMIKDDVEAGATLVLGGSTPIDKPEGFFVQPTILTGITPEMRCYKEEIFGPVAGMMKFSTLEEAIEIGNDTEYGLVSYIFTNNHSTVEKASEELEFGEVQVNGVRYSINLPHGGIKESGIGHDCSYLALHDYLVKKRITIAK